MVAGNAAVLLMPLALDLLLWLGPRLSLQKMMKPVLESNFPVLVNTYGFKPDELKASVDGSNQLLQALNLFGALRTFPVGISSLMSGSMPTSTPWGAPQIVDLSSASQVFGLFLLLVLAGWVLGAIYFLWVAALATPGMEPLLRPDAARAVMQTVIYAAVWSVLACIVAVPVSILLLVLMAVNGALAQGVLVLLLFISMWLVVPIFFSPHGIFVRRQSAMASILSGFEMTRFTLPTSSLFVLLVLLMSMGTNYLWSLAAADTWLVLAAIFGHAFVTTALLAASFVYYNNMTAWLRTALARLRAGLPGQQTS